MSNTINKAVGGDKTHQMVALSYMKQGTNPIDAMEQLKAANYVVSLNGSKYKIKASSVASIITGFNLMIHQITSGKATCTKAGGLKWK